MRIKNFTEEQIAKIHIYPSRGGGGVIRVKKSKITKKRVDFQVTNHFVGTNE